jgi:hypothetical protein
MATSEDDGKGVDSSSDVLDNFYSKNVVVAICPQFEVQAIDLSRAFPFLSGCRGRFA